MFIYKITNKVNDKVYIGQTVRPINKRFNRHINDAIRNKLDTHFARAIRKYGKDNFTFEILRRNLSVEEAIDLEKQYITNLNTLIPNGYNVDPGGNYHPHIQK
jgi:group I intron endonuclease